MSLTSQLIGQLDFAYKPPVPVFLLAVVEILTSQHLVVVVAGVNGTEVSNAK